LYEVKGLCKEEFKRFVRRVICMKRTLLTMVMISCVALVGCNLENSVIAENEENTTQQIVVEESITEENTTEETSSQQDVSEENTTVQENDDVNQITNGDVQENGVQEGDAYVIFKEMISNYFMDHINTYSLELNPDEVDFGFVLSADNEDITITDAYVVRHTSGRTFLVVSYDSKGGDYVSECYDVAGDAAVLCDKIENVTVGYYDADEHWFSGMVTINVLGTYWADMKYTLDENGTFNEMTEVYSISIPEHAIFYELVAAIEVPVYMEDEYTTLQPGTIILVTGTNNVNEMYFKVVDSNETGIITFERDEETGEITIDGVPEGEYFPNLPYINY